MTIKKLNHCCICGKLIESPYGENNPAGAMWKDEIGNIVEPEFKPEDVCCNDCNTKYVIPGRLYKMTRERR